MTMDHVPAPRPLGRRAFLLGAVALVGGCGGRSSPGASVVGTSPGPSDAPASGTAASTTPSTVTPSTVTLKRRTSTTPAPPLDDTAPSLPPRPPTTPDPLPGEPTTSVPSHIGGARPAGLVAARNSRYVVTVDVATGRERRFEPADSPTIDPGVAVNRDGVLSVAVARGRDGFDLDLYDPAGRRLQSVSYTAELSFLTSAATFDRSGRVLAFSVDELTSATDDTRIARTVVYRLDTGAVSALIDGVVEPVWTGERGELIVREADGDRVRVVDASGGLGDRIDGVVVEPTIGAYDVSPDGRYLVWQEGRRILALDRDTGERWTAVSDRISRVRSPAVSPDGRFLAVVSNVVKDDSPHVVPFEPGRTVELDSTTQAVELSITDLRGRIGWMAPQ